MSALSVKVKAVKCVTIWVKAHEKSIVNYVKKAKSKEGLKMIGSYQQKMIYPEPEKFEFKFGWVDRKVLAGSYYHRPKTHHGIKMAVEIDAAHTISIPTRDFSVPSMDAMQEGMREALELIAKDEPVYVGCMGGIGRTGLFLACLAKVLGYPKPVGYVRANYSPLAVETSRQMQFVQDFDITPFQNRLIWLKLKALWYSL
jgi:protein tyrosine phosphatase